MIDYKYFDLFQHSRGSVDKDWKIEYDGGSFTDWDMESESMELTESLCSGTELRFGSCEASCLKFTTGNIVRPLINEWLTLSVTIDHHNDEPLVVGRYKVASEELTADRQYKKIVAYDAMYDIINSDVTEWYNSVLPDKDEDTWVTMRSFRTSFIRHFGLEQEETELANDYIKVERTIEPEQISGRDVITAICEINGCFGHIGRDGKFHYIYLPQAIEGLYPANDLYPDHAPEWMAQAGTGHLYPQDPKSSRIGKGSYIPPCNYGSFRTKPITRIQIRQEEDDIGKIWPETPPSEEDNCYIIQGNFLVYGKSSDELSVIAQNILGRITDIIYRPFDCTAVGNPCLEVGDPVRLNTKYDIVESYILRRTLKGIQALRDTYTADGAERYVEKLNGVQKSIMQLKGKSNVLTRTIEETRLEMADVEKGLSTDIRVTAAGLRAEAAQTYETKADAGTEYGSIRSSISLESGRISMEIERATKAEQSLSGTITSTEKTLSSRIEQTESSINLSVDAKIQETRTYAQTEAAGARDSANNTTAEKLKSYSTTTEMNSAIRIAADSINLSVDKKITETKEYADDAAATVDGKLANYSTTTQMNAAIKLSADNITSEVAKTYETKTDASVEYSSIRSSVQQNADSITAEVSRASSAEQFLSARVSITENGLTSKVSKGDVSSEISQEAGKIHLEADRLSWSSTYSSMEEDGTFSTSSANITGGQIEVLGTTQEETRVAVRYKDEYATEISASGINCHLKYTDGRFLRHISLGPTASYISSPLTVGEDVFHHFYSLYVGGNKNSYISNVLELENPTVVGSDRRLKDKVRYVSGRECLGNIRKLDQAEFEYIKTPGLLHHGIIAQDAQDAFTDGWSPVRTSGEYLGVAYEEIIADLIGAVKYLAEEIGT